MFLSIVSKISYEAFYTQCLVHVLLVSLVHNTDCMHKLHKLQKLHKLHELQLIRYSYSKANMHAKRIPVQRSLVFHVFKVPESTPRENNKEVQHGKFNKS